MTTTDFWAMIGILVSGFGWLIYKVEKLESKTEGIGNRLMKVETQMEGLEKRMTSLENQMLQLQGMMQTVVSCLIGSKTGTEK